MNETESLRQEISELRTKLAELDDWTNGIQMALVAVLPFLLRGHPEAAKAQDVLQAADQRYEELLAHPERAESADETATLYESRKMLNRLLALTGVWPGVAPMDAAQALQKARQPRAARSRPRNKS